MSQSASPQEENMAAIEFILDLVDVLTKSLLVAMKNNNFIISEEVVWSILGNTLPQTIADFLDIKDTVECASATSLTRLLVKEAVTSVKSAVSCNSQAEGFMESEHVTSHHRLDVMVGHAIRMLRTIGAKMKGLFRFRLRKEKRAMETSTDGQKGDDVNDEKSHESSGPSKTSEVDYTLFQTPVAPLFQTSETGSAHSKTSERQGLPTQKPQRSTIPSFKSQGPGLPTQNQLLPSFKPQRQGLPTQKPQRSTIPSFKSQGPSLPSQKPQLLPPIKPQRQGLPSQKPQRPNLHSLIDQGPYLDSLKPQPVLG
ncbi:Zonadhesin [Dissostichus eleginoides]|uniref:Zonadhesin n=1 Tax=Dissostichus eleginoides TaxID=100907 RepID=A0AAD9C7J9_DISEL|nr:Zonadhesin [Dissostichus eleginoides]